MNPFINIGLRLGIPLAINLLATLYRVAKKSPEKRAMLKLLEAKKIVEQIREKKK